MFFGEIDPDLLSYGTAQKGLHINGNDKDFRTFKMGIQKGNRRLILNMVTKIRNLIVKSITAGRG